MAVPLSNIEIANCAKLWPIGDVAEKKLGLSVKDLEPFGWYKAKVPLAFIKKLPYRPSSKLILMTAMTPTMAGEGKTTTSVGLVDGLNCIGKKAMAALREPSLGPCFGMKGGACGGGYAQVVPMSDINLHFTGDFHAITSAHNLLAAMVDNHLYWGHSPMLDARRITWRRTMDMNDRSLRSIVTGIGSVTNGFAREGKFDITAASEVMAILCLATDLHDLQRRLGNIKVGRTAKKEFVFAKDIKAEGAMTALLKDALNPNLVQTLEHNPAFVHGGPFGNIAHGCNSVVATNAALKLADYVVTEAGFGADLGAEKFLNIKCRRAGFEPACAVVVATVKALKLHGGVNPKELGTENLEAVNRGLPNLVRHLDNLKKFGVPVLVAINQFASDTKAELDLVHEICAGRGVKVALSNHWAHGGEGARALAELVVKTIENEPSKFHTLYPDEMSLAEKVRTVSREIYGADDADIPYAVLKRFEELENAGYGHYPVCMAKTQYSFSTDPSKKGAPTGFTIPIREVRLSLGAEFIVVLTGDIMTMPGLPQVPAAEVVGVDSKGDILGLF
ncbi:formate--tetrahydrofolate ligase [Candidatus Nitronereus thalassa]|uniref:Formate--tetrahydrofolate ligase n=1 Tax=Candidatus Nitronereus thalassa TaxID=3020898 RepID=A0ABU3K3D4_9BACT|nr:formate--tetrahydrofolate ligase [Candidatus Nitronereus thalassa]MDT7040894.1 formate--tetrahydrofolate ligase [Candidatus Nitronereus thalassa]